MNSSIPLLIVLLSSLSMASVNLIGTIVNKDNNHLLIGANVILVQDDKINGTATDGLGNYVISNINLGKYDLIVSYIGYDTYKKEIIINQKTPEKYKLDIALTQSSLIIDEYVVTASRGKREKITDAPAAISIISQRKIRTASITQLKRPILTLIARTP